VDSIEVFILGAVLNILFNLTTGLISRRIAIKITRWGWLYFLLHATYLLLNMEWVKSIAVTFRGLFGSSEILSYLIVVILGGLVGLAYWKGINRIYAALFKEPTVSSQSAPPSTIDNVADTWVRMPTPISSVPPPPDAETSKGDTTAKAKLVGRIICLNAESRWNTWQERFDDNYPRDFIATLNVSVTSDTTMGASVTRFDVSMIWNGKTFPCLELPIGSRAFLKRVRPVPGGGPRSVGWEQLHAFPLNTEITNTTHQAGWLRFWAGPIQDFKLEDVVRLRVVAFDHRNDPHTIYDGLIKELPRCGEIAEGFAQDPKPGRE
jgi:hypothetical protein